MLERIKRYFLEKVGLGYLVKEIRKRTLREIEGLPIPQKTSQLENDSDFVTETQMGTALNGKQDTLTAGENITIVNNVISATGGGGGTSDYTNLENKPQINNITLTGNKTLQDLGAPEITYSTTDLTPGVSQLADNEIYFVYE